MSRIDEIKARAKDFSLAVNIGLISKDIPFLLRMVELMAAAMKGEYIGGKRYESIKDIIEHFEREAAK